MAINWRGDITFADRLAVTSKMQIEYHELVGKNVQLLLASNDTIVNTQDHHTNEHIFPNLPTSGSSIGRYIHAQHHANGIFSEVFKAIDPDANDNDSNKHVALKITTPDMMTAPHDSKREARVIQAAKSDHVIALLNTFHQAGGHFVLVFPFMPLALDGLLRNNVLTDSTRRTMLRDLFSGLAHLHDLDIIHRDVKPGNILLRSPIGPAYLSDFGIAWSSIDPASEPENEKILDVGTTCYRPPELLFGQQAYTSSLDMWAAGCVAAQITSLSSKTLFDAGDLGSELALIKSHFETLGTPTLASWPEAESLPDWGKMNFTQYQGGTWDEILPNATAEAKDLMSSLVVFESGRRLMAKEALAHPYLQSE
ncbi:mitogen-activated protein kinase [Recurvomyces mirabilis]|nr:mitogen-activated protein kinase [Recurvomyces mirabilis]